jgi:predicted ATPase
VLVLDNFEQVTAAAPVVAELLAAAPGLVVLATSRAVLRLNGEHEFAVAPLPTPPADITRTGDLRRYASLRLFAERARAAVPGFQLTRANTEVVAEICRRLDGLPLAIELAASRVRLLQPQALLARLDNRLDLLTGGARDLPARQRTLRSTLDWSFSLLSPAEQALFRRLSVFSASFDLEAVEAIGSESYGPGSADPDRPGEVIDTFGSLVHASLVRAVDRDGRLRFSLLETIREYALERLRESGEWDEAHDRHAAHFLALAESAGDGLEGPGQVAWLDRLETEHGNLGAAMRWFLDQSHPGLTDRMGALTWRFWWFRGHAEEFARYAEMTIAMADQMPSDEGGWAHVGLGFMLIASGDQARARALFEQGRALFRRVGDRNGIAITSAALGHLAALRHEYAQAEELLEKGLAQVQDLDVNEYVGAIYNFLGQIPFTQGDNHAAARLFTQGLNAARRGPDRMPLLISLYDLALTHQASEDLDGAARLLREGLSVASDIGDDSSVGYYLQRLASLARSPARAVRLLAAADALLQAAGTGWLQAYVPAAPPEDRSLPALRQQMGEAAFQQAWARGAAMGRQRAVAYALRADDLPRAAVRGDAHAARLHQVETG